MNVPPACRCGLALAALLAAASVGGQEAAPVPGANAKPLKATMAKMEKVNIPKYPADKERLGQEGWVVLSFVVSPDGTVVDPIVEDSSGQPSFEREALKAVASQRYTPATIDGKPVEQCATQVRYMFSIPSMPRGGRREFAPKFRDVRALIQSGDRDAATKALDELLKTGTWNHYEASRLYLLRYELCKETNDADCMLNSVTRAASQDGANLEPKLYREVLEVTAALQIQSELYGDALATIERRNALGPRLPAEHPLSKAAIEIRRQIDGDGTLVFAGKVGYRSGCEVGAPNWRHQLLRREFAVDPGQGKIDKVEIRCDWRRVTDSITPDKTWRVPPSWGDCHVFVFGDPDATFKLVEYPLVAQETAVAP